MRTKVYSLPKIKCLSQGYIFNSPIIHDYTALNSYGIIITPRCDLEHDKVSTVHFLPALELSYFLTRVYRDIFVTEYAKLLRSRICNIFISNSISPNILHAQCSYLIDLCQRIKNKKKSASS